MTPENFLEELKELKERIKWFESKVMETTKAVDNTPKESPLNALDFNGLWQTDKGNFVSMFTYEKHNYRWVGTLIINDSDTTILTFDDFGRALSHPYGDLQTRAPVGLGGAPLMDKSINWPILPLCKK